MADSHLFFKLQSLLLAADAYGTLDTNRETLFQLLPELRPMVGYSQSNPYHSRDLWDHTIYSVSQVPADPVLRLTMLLHDIGKLTTRTTDDQGIDHFYGHPQVGLQMCGPILERLGLSAADCLTVLRLIALHDEALPSSPAGLRAMVDQYGVSFMVKLIQVKQADALAQNPDKLADRVLKLEQIRSMLTGVH